MEFNLNKIKIPLYKSGIFDYNNKKIYKIISETLTEAQSLRSRAEGRERVEEIILYILKSMEFNIITIFPKIFSAKGGYLDESILKRAQKNKLIEIKVHNLRDFTKDKHRKVDDRPFGGGPGMVLQIQPLIRAVEFVKLRIKKAELRKKTKVIIFSPTGKIFDNKMAAQMAKKYDNLILICGRYEGIDARVEKVIKNLKFKIENLSIGDYVLTGGELPAMALIDSVSRQIPGVLGKQESLEEKRGMLGAAAYTRPEIFEYKGKKYKVPKILLSGDHKKIEEWRKKARGCI